MPLKTRFGSCLKARVNERKLVVSMKKNVYLAPAAEAVTVEFDCPVMNNSTDYHYGGGFGDDDDDDYNG